MDFVQQVYDSLNQPTQPRANEFIIDRQSSCPDWYRVLRWRVQVHVDHNVPPFLALAPGPPERLNGMPAPRPIVQNEALNRADTFRAAERTDSDLTSSSEVEEDI